jgi:hypothetical protein
MDYEDRRIFSFIIKIILEPRSHAGRWVKWRGNIQEVPNGERRAVNSLHEIVFTIYQSLEQKGVRFSPVWRLLRRLHQSFSKPGSR